MNQTKLRGNPIKLHGTVPGAGTKASDFTYVREDLSEKKLYDHGSKIKVLIAVPSLDTGICQIETRRFNKELSNKANAVGIVISKDLPFAMKRFCAAEGLENIEIASDFRGNFSTTYKTLMEEGPMKGLSARVVFVVDGNNTIRYAEIVEDITHEPNYKAVMDAVDAI